VAEQNIGMKQTFVSGEASDAIAKWRIAVLHTTEGQIVNPSGASSIEKIAGATEAAISAGAAAAIIMSGIVYLQATAAAIAIGDTVVIGDNVGRIMAKPINTTTQGIAIVGVALSAASGTVDDVVKVFLTIRNEYAT
jgi:hypothetical protein